MKSRFYDRQVRYVRACAFQCFALIGCASNRHLICDESHMCIYMYIIYIYIDIDIDTDDIFDIIIFNWWKFCNILSNKYRAKNYLQIFENNLETY